MNIGFLITARLKSTRLKLKILKTFLEYLSLMPLVVHGIDGENIISENLEIDEKVLKDLESL